MWGWSVLYVDKDSKQQPVEPGLQNTRLYGHLKQEAMQNRESLEPISVPVTYGNEMMQCQTDYAAWDPWIPTSTVCSR